MRWIPLLLAASLAGVADDRGVSPRPQASDYPASQSGKTAGVGAVLVPVQKIERMLNGEIAKHYAVLEVAVYPRDGQTVDVDRLDFRLKIGDEMSFAERPSDVATPWREKNPPSTRLVTVVSDTGVVYSKTSDPVNGRRSGWGVYEGVGATNDPRAAGPTAPPPNRDADSRMIEGRVRELSLPEGRTSVPVAGFLFFPLDKAKVRKGAVMELRWTKDGESATLRVPVK
jgi:hypothetical protein